VKHAAHGGGIAEEAFEAGAQRIKPEAFRLDFGAVDFRSSDGYLVAAGT
jgi:hypothetical protein